MVYVNAIRKAPVNRIEIKSNPAPVAEKPQEAVTPEISEDEKPKRGRKAKED